MENKTLLHEIAITAIILKKGKFLITKRSSIKKKDFLENGLFLVES